MNQSPAALKLLHLCPRLPRTTNLAGGLPEFKELILLWVETPEGEGGKAKDSRDADKTDDEIAEHVAGVMLGSNKGAQEARRRLLPHILQWLKDHGADFGLDPKDIGESHAGAPGFLDFISGQGLDPAVVDVWLRAVLEAWKVMVLAGFPERFRQELVKMRDEL